MGLPPIDLQVFHENGYTRRSCRVTGLWFWSSDPNRDTCGDTEEDEYTFIGAPIIDGFSQRGRELKDAMREQFIAHASPTTPGIDAMFTSCDIERSSLLFAKCSGLDTIMASTFIEPCFRIRISPSPSTSR